MITPTYQEFVHLIDYKMMSIQKHNARKFLMAHNQQIQYEQQIGFKSATKERNTTGVFHSQGVFRVYRMLFGMLHAQSFASKVKTTIV